MRLQNLTEERKKEAGSRRGVELKALANPDSRIEQSKLPALKKLVLPSNLPFFCNRKRLMVSVLKPLATRSGEFCFDS